MLCRFPCELNYKIQINSRVLINVLSEARGGHYQSSQPLLPETAVPPSHEILRFQEGGMPGLLQNLIIILALSF